MTDDEDSKNGDSSVTQRLVVELAEVRKRMAARAQQTNPKGKVALPPPRRASTSGSFDAIKEPIVLKPPEPEDEEEP